MQKKILSKFFLENKLLKCYANHIIKSMEYMRNFYLLHMFHILMDLCRDTRILQE